MNYVISDEDPYVVVNLKYSGTPTEPKCEIVITINGIDVAYLTPDKQLLVWEGDLKKAGFTLDIQE